MEKIQLCLLITSYINIVTGQMKMKPADVTDPPVPDKCHLHDAMYKQCCVFPPFFTRDIARECGAKIKISERQNAVEMVILRRQMFDKCRFWTCMLNRYDLIDPTDLVNDKKYFEHLDRWVNLNPHFAKVIAKAKVHCKLYFRVNLPLKPCQFYELQQCVRNFVNLHCPTQAILGTATCEKLAKFYEECADYYL